VEQEALTQVVALVQLEATVYLTRLHLMVAVVVVGLITQVDQAAQAAVVVTQVMVAVQVIPHQLHLLRVAMAVVPEAAAVAVVAVQVPLEQLVAAEQVELVETEQHHL
jgi:hypothetical protein